MRGELKNGQERVLYVTTSAEIYLLPDDLSFKRWINDLLFVKICNAIPSSRQTRLQNIHHLRQSPPRIS